MQFWGQDKSIHQRFTPKTGVLLTNLGTPDAPETNALRRYLGEFLSDPRVIEIPRWKWWPILHGIILRFRPAKSAALYRSVWTENGSPLLDIAKQQCAALTQSFSEQGQDAVVVKLAMRYGNPAIGPILREFQSEGINRIVVLPLYPQYSATTVGSTFDAVAAELVRWRWLPELHFINAYYDHPRYIAALAQSVRNHFQQQGKPEKLVFSYHGMPQRYFDEGDPYYCFCQKTTRLVAELLGLQEGEYLTSFQSIFGREQWLKPYTDATLEQLAKDGTRHVAIICPGFSADCLETLEEIEHENREVFTAAGGTDYHYIPALNAEPEHIAMMRELVQPYLPTARD